MSDRELLKKDGFTAMPLERASDTWAMLRDGIEPRMPDPKVSNATVQWIAIARTVLLGAAMLSATAAMVPAWKLRYQETTAKATWMVLGVNSCFETGTLMSGGRQIALDDDRKTVLTDAQAELVRFKPSTFGRESYRNFPTIEYYESEELYAGGPNLLPGNTLGLFTRTPVQINVDFVENTTGLSCNPNRTASTDPEEMEAQYANTFAASAVDALHASKKRLPQDWSLSSPQSHGALLVWREKNLVWSASAGRFAEPYRPSQAWLLYWRVTVATRLVAGLTACFLAWRTGKVLLEQAIQVWNVQYGSIWDKIKDDVHVDPRAMAPEDRSMVAFRELKSLSDTFKYKYQAYSPFFILDHITGDPQFNSEHWQQGLVATLVQALVLVSLAVLPLVQSAFFPEWKPIAMGVIVFHFLAAATFGGTYYCAVPWPHREVFFRSHCMAVGAISAYNIFYLSSIAMFLATRLVVDPVRSVAYVATIGSAIAFVAVGSHAMMTLRSQIQNQLAGKKTRGMIIKLFEFLGLDIKSMVAAMIWGVLGIFLFSGMQLLASQLYAEGGTLAERITSITTAVTTVGGTVKMLQMKMATWTSMAASDEDIIAEIL